MPANRGYRRQTITHRVKTTHGTMYAHVECSNTGAVTNVELAQPGKVQESELGNVLDRIVEAFNAGIADINGQSAEESDV